MRDLRGGGAEHRPTASARSERIGAVVKELVATHRIEHITVRAELSDAREELERATRWVRDGERDWQAWIDDWHAGIALVLRLRVSVDVVLDDGGDARFECVNRSVWVEKHVDPPRIQEQVREIAGKDFDTLAGQMRDAGVDVAPSDLEDMYVDVRLDASLRDALSKPPALGRGMAPRRRLGPDA